jgi:Tfp pilus assembly protein PilV
LEVIVAITVLSIGLLGMGTTMLYGVRSVTTADLASERAAARQAGVERLRATPYDSLAIGQDSVGIFAVAWGPLVTTSASTSMRVITLGPGSSVGPDGPSLSLQVADTFDFLVLKP